MLPSDNEKKEHDIKAYEYLKNYSRVLDIGCGEGRFIELAPEKIVGVDSNPRSVQKCREKGYNVTKADARSLPFADGSVPAVHCSHVIEHFLPADVHRILSEIDRVLEKGGIFVIRSPLLYQGFYSDLTHVRPYNPQAIMSYFAESRQKTMNVINPHYKEITVEWRFDPIEIKNIFLYKMINGFIKKYYPWLRRNGYMLVMQKLT